VDRINAHNLMGTFKRMENYYFQPEQPFAIHPRCQTYMLFAACLAFIGWRLKHAGERALLVCCALGFAILPLWCGVLRQQFEIFFWERFASFYDVAFLVAGLLWLRQQTSAIQGRGGRLQARRWIGGLRGLALICVAVLAIVNWRYDFCNKWVNHRVPLFADLKYLDAYRWVEKNTPPDALFLVDDGYNWTRIKAGPEGLPLPEIEMYGPNGEGLCSFDDHFKLVACRQRVFDQWLCEWAVPSALLRRAKVLERGTFGYPVNKHEYLEALESFHPDYVLWKKSCPVPRGFGQELIRGETVYDDAASQIWKIKWPEKKGK
jgi:hypothetical protein